MPSHYSSRNKTRVLYEATLVDQLNTLLSSLNIPIALISPTDLTPSLLVAILESMLSMRIPLIDRSRESKCFKSSKIHNMKIFLGFLEIDILKTDVGLSDIDPRRLADGEVEEVTFLAELLCWMGRRKGLIPRPRKHDEKTIIPRRPHKSSPPQPQPVTPLSPKSQLDLDAISVFQTGSTATGSTRPSTHLFSSFVKDTDKESITAFDTTEEHEEENESYDGYSDGLSDILGSLPPFTKPQPPARCIHEVPSPSLLFSRAPESPSRSTPSHPKVDQTFRSNLSNDLYLDRNASASTSNNIDSQYEHSADRSNTSVRYTGFIELVDEESEIASFELSRSLSFKDTSFLTKKSQQPVKMDTFKEQYARTRELLTERARLLNQLAELKLSNG